MLAKLLASTLKTSILKLLSLLLTEKLFNKVISRLTVSSLEFLVKSTKTEVDDITVQPIIDKLKEEY